jgi:hypothetical protein
MPLLPIKYKREGYKLAGVSLPLPAHNYLVLHSLAKGTTKSKILTRLINNWIKRQKEKEPESTLIHEITQRCNDEWRIRKANNGDFDSIIDYKKGVTDEFINKGLTEAQVYNIIKGIKER